MDQIMKQARLMKAAPDEGEMALVNAQALRELGAEEVFTFRLAACNNQVDRDLERFSDAALEGLAEKFVGRPVLMDHCWSAGSQTARVYAARRGAHAETEGGKQLVLRVLYAPAEGQRGHHCRHRGRPAAGVQRGGVRPAGGMLHLRDRLDAALVRAQQGPDIRRGDVHHHPG